MIPSFWDAINTCYVVAATPPLKRKRDYVFAKSSFYGELYKLAAKSGKIFLGFEFFGKVGYQRL